MQKPSVRKKPTLARVPPSGATPAGPAAPITPPPPIRLDPSQFLKVPAPTVSPTPPKSSLLAPSDAGAGQRAPVAIRLSPTTSPKSAASVSSACSPSLVEGFEGTLLSDCWALRGQPTWGTTGFLAHSGSQSAWCAEDGLNAYTDDYANNMDAWMVYGPFDLSRVSWANLHFSYWNRSEAGFDFFRWRVSVDGDTFYHDINTERSGDSQGWQNVTFDLRSTPLGDLTGRSSVWIAFTFSSDFINTDWGAFVDDMWLEVPQANLTPYTPNGWASPLVPSSVMGIHYVDTLDANGNTYVDWAVTNNGDADTGPVYFWLYLGDVLLQEWYAENIPAGASGVVEDWEISAPSPGWHWLRLVVDSWGTVDESNEWDNVREEEFYWHAPDLAPYTPDGWSHPIVASSSYGTNTDTELFAGREVWVDWAIKNYGSLPARNLDVALYRDGTAIGWQHVEYLAPQEHYAVQDLYISGIPVIMDNHTLRVVADAGGTVRESIESNNTWEGSFFWWHHLGQVFDPNPVVTSGDTNLVDNNNQDSPALNSQLRVVNLAGLDASGTVRGSYVDLTAAVPVELLSTGCSRGQAYDPGFNFLYTRSDTRFEEVTPYHHVDAIARFLPSIGFPNIFTGPIKVYPHCDVTGHYSQQGVIALGRLSVDAGEDAEIVAHEVAHLIQFAQIGDWTQNNTEGGAMGEGFGYYWPASYFSAKNPATPLNPPPVTFRTCLGEWGYSTGQPNCMWPVISNKHYPEDMTPNNDGHLDGQIWSAALWDIWTALGRATTDRIVLHSHDVLTPPRPSARFGEGADGIIRADLEINGGANHGTIASIFRQRGIFDASELDNTPPDAQPITPNGASQTHNFHSRSDIDWTWFTNGGANLFLIQTTNLQSNADTILDLYRSDASTLVASNDDCTPGSRTSCLSDVALTPGTYYVRLRPKSDNNTGRNTNYQLSVTTTGTWTPSYPVYLPLITKE